MFAVMVLRAENWTIFCPFVCWKRRPSASAASLVSGKLAIRGPAGTKAAAPMPALSWSFRSAVRAGSESQGSVVPKSARAEVCAKRIADGSPATAAFTISRLAWNVKGMCFSAAPACEATSRAKSSSHLSSSAAYLTASGSRLAHSMTNALSDLRAADAPFSAEPRCISAASRMRPWSPRSSSLAPANAAPFTLMACITNSRSLLSTADASARRSGLYFTASRMTFRSSRSSGAA
mmetsp:Transcript_106361/g.343092  ORF Transcript_106361/g.343092 Transcript_106361/m.343092 type:complete len:235 (+) Transcript_106361:994-1698(+)